VSRPPRQSGAAADGAANISSDPRRQPRLNPVEQWGVYFVPKAQTPGHYVVVVDLRFSENRWHRAVHGRTKPRVDGPQLVIVDRQDKEDLGLKTDQDTHFWQHKQALHYLLETEFPYEKIGEVPLDLQEAFEKLAYDIENPRRPPQKRNRR
jgi:hypothetical protein